ncbi:MAG: SIMPL domain-containing protein [Candidatus Nitrosocosmicus sp.]|nr:SIMPL domain-containing protein [Candidatus Nitrosocosmicus sp.]
MSNYYEKNLKRNVSNLTILLFLGLGLGFVSLTVMNMAPIGVFAQATVSGQDNKTQLASLNNTLFVSGSATDKVNTDLVTISIGVQSINISATDALISNSKIANEIITSLRDNGVQENEISTSQYTIQPNYNFTESGNSVKTGFTVSNILTVQSSNFNNISSWIDSAVNAGANTINGVDFKVSDKSLESVKNTLIEQAIINAKQNADIASSAIGSTIVGIKSISVNTGGFNPMPSSDQIMQRSFASGASSTPILPGEQEVSVTVQITYRLN